MSLSQDVYYGTLDTQFTLRFKVLVCCGDAWSYNQADAKEACLTDTYFLDIGKSIM